MRRVLCSVLLLLLTAAVFSAALNRNGVDFVWEYNLVPEDYDKAVVSKNVDGDTIRIMLDGKEEIIRMIGVDTPETVHPSKPVEFFGKEASNFTKAMVPVGSEVYVTYDWDPRDKYNRLLAYIWYKEDGKWILHNLNLIANGYGFAYTSFAFDDDYKQTFIEAERTARNDDRGLWKKENEGKQETSTSDGIAIQEVQPEGSDEFVILVNNGSTTVNLKGWKMISTSGNQEYVFPDVTISVGGTVEVHSGKNASGPLIWSKGYIHNNKSDGVELYSPDGKLVDSERW
jgi:micrococcal nuclease